MIYLLLLVIAVVIAFMFDVGMHVLLEEEIVVSRFLKYWAWFTFGFFLMALPVSSKFEMTKDFELVKIENTCTCKCTCKDGK